jgi:hypothetical protein
MHMFISTEKGWKVEISNEVPIGLCRGLIWVHSLGPSHSRDRAELGSIITFPPGLQTNQPSSVLLLQGSRGLSHDNLSMRPVYHHLTTARTAAHQAHTKQITDKNSMSAYKLMISQK